MSSSNGLQQNQIKGVDWGCPSTAKNGPLSKQVNLSHIITCFDESKGLFTLGQSSREVICQTFLIFGQEVKGGVH